MNPAGISMFYCSQNKNLTIKEVVDFDSKTKLFYTTAIFRNIYELKLVDLSKLPEPPSIFDNEESPNIEVLNFLREFVIDISKPIDNNDSITEYIPTQVVTEYLRFNPALNVDGIIYPSAKDNTFTNIVLFYDDEKCMANLKYSRFSRRTSKIV